MDFNYIQILFTLKVISVVSLGYIVRIAEPHLPVAIRKLVKFGKFSVEEKSSIIPTVEVPKRWFKHFYEFAAPTVTCVLFIALRSYLGYGAVPHFFYPFLDLVIGPNRKPLVSSAHATLALVLLTIQCWKRFYETHSVSIFSDGKMNLGHYIIGFLHYIGAISCLIGEAQGFTTGPLHQPTINWNKLNRLDYLCAVIFLWASYKQLKSNLILANLRKNEKGEVVTLQHKVPKGGLFDYISSPLQFTEILMYFMLTIILWKSVTYHFVFVWVLTNQISAGLFSHWWYIEKFEDYPKHRKAVIPYIL